MRNAPLHGVRFFFSTPPQPCPYISGQVERRLITELAGRNADVQHDALSRAGFRRSHGIAYAPSCPNCNACQALRVHVGKFQPSRTQRRIWKRNQDISVSEGPPVATAEQYNLFERYQYSRHSDGDMARMDYFDYRALVEDTPVRTWLAEFRDPDKRLVGTCLTDALGDGLSAVYSFFDPGMSRRSLGSTMILWLIRRSRELGLPHAYLGFWIAQSAKMSYKAAYRPSEIYVNGVWKQLEVPEPSERPNMVKQPLTTEPVQ